MIVGIHQPNYLPYLGFFDKMRKSDIFIIYDDAQFNKHDFQRRNRIRVVKGWKWLTIPVIKELLPITDINILNELPEYTPRQLKILKELPGNTPYWSKVHFKEIHANYAKTEYFPVYEDGLKNIYAKHYEKLIDLNMSIIDFLRKAFDINTKIVFSSEFELKSSSSQKILDIVKAVGGDVYLSGSMGHNYLDVSLFEKDGIDVIYQDFKEIVYKQRYEDFVPNLAAIDALFNVGMMPE